MSLIHGESVEALFFYEATRRGLVVSLPISTVRFDCVVSQPSGVLQTHRVQIKGAMLDRGSRRTPKFVMGRSYDKTPYTELDTDILAMFWGPTRQWYFMWTKDLPSHTVRIQVLKYKHYGWEIFG